MEEFELELGETIIKVVHQHWFFLLGRLLPFAILAWLPTFLIPFFASAENAAGISSLNLFGIDWGAPLVHFGLGAWWLILWISAFTIVTKYFLSVWVITTERIVDISQESLFSRKVSSFLLARVQDITTDVDGIFGTLIGYGTLNVETAGRDEKFAMDGVAHPEAIRDLIMREITELQNHDSLGTKIAKTVGDALI